MVYSTVYIILTLLQLVFQWFYIIRLQLVDIWVSLGFDAPDGRKASSDAKAKKLDMGLNMVGDSW